jgi:glycosyltransferase involved in cell wall biosynthesis
MGVKKKMKISIITPALNSEKFIGNALESIHLLQSGDFSIEHIIVDGGSNDKTLDIINGFRNKYDANIIVLQGKDKNMYDAINKGLKKMSGDIWACLNTDDQYFPGILEEVVKEFRKSSEIEVVYGQVEYISEEGKVLYSEKLPNFNLKSLVIAKGCFGISQPATFLAKDVLSKVGFFDISYNYASDYDYLIRVGKVCKMRLFNKRITKFMIREEALSSSKNLKEKYIKESEEITNKYMKMFGINKKNLLLYAELYLNQMIYEKTFFQRNFRNLINYPKKLRKNV